MKGVDYPGSNSAPGLCWMRRIGRGGSAEVWLAVDRERGERVALKFFDEALAGDAARSARLEAEVAKAKTLPAGYTVAVHGLEQVEGRTFLVMEFLEGGDLGQLRGRSFESWSQAVDDVAVALEALHARGLVHRDLKCANVFLDAAGRAKLGDFGLTALAGSPAAGGSPYNASPQQLRARTGPACRRPLCVRRAPVRADLGPPAVLPGDHARARAARAGAAAPAARCGAGGRARARAPPAFQVAERKAGSATIARAKLAVAAADEGGALKSLAHAAPAALPGRSRSARLLPLALGVVAIVAVVVIFMMPARKAADDSGFAEKARQEAEQESEVKRRGGDGAGGTGSRPRERRDRARRLQPPRSSRSMRAAARWATAEFAKARDAGDHAAQRFAGRRLPLRDAGLARGVGDARRPRQGAAEGARGCLEARHGCARRREDRRRTRGLPARACDRAEEPAGDRWALRAPTGSMRRSPPRMARGAMRKRAAPLRPRRAIARRSRSILAVRAQRRASIAWPRAGPPTPIPVAMSRGFADSAAGSKRAPRARPSTRRAALRPGAREAKDALAALDQGQRASALNLLEARARTAESGERWDEALGRLARGGEPRALARVGAREGLTRATPRAELQRGIDALIAKPERLWDPAGRAEARNLIAAAASAGNPRERLGRRRASSNRLATAAQVAGAAAARVGWVHAGRDLPRRAIWDVLHARRGALCPDAIPSSAPAPGSATCGARCCCRRAPRLRRWWCDARNRFEGRLAGGSARRAQAAAVRTAALGRWVLARPSSFRAASRGGGARISLTTQGLAVTPEAGAGPDALDGVQVALEDREGRAVIAVRHGGVANVTRPPQLESRAADAAASRSHPGRDTCLRAARGAARRAHGRKAGCHDAASLGGARRDRCRALYLFTATAVQVGSNPDADLDRVDFTGTALDIGFRGRYLVPPGQYALRVEAEGYAPAMRGRHGRRPVRPAHRHRAPSACRARSPSTRPASRRHWWWTAGRSARFRREYEIARRHARTRDQRASLRGGAPAHSK